MNNLFCTPGCAIVAQPNLDINFHAFLRAYSKVPPQQPEDFGEPNNQPRVFRVTNSENCAYITFHKTKTEKSTSNFCICNFLKKLPGICVKHQLA